MGGIDGSRGYLVQSVIAILDSLREGNWETVQIEPDETSQKIDILWVGSAGKKAVQVKSSINQIGKADAERWANEFRLATTADNYALVLVGPCAQSVVEMQSFHGVSIPQPKNLDINGLLSEGAHLLGKFLENEGMAMRSSTQLEFLTKALTTHFTALSICSKSISRINLATTLKQWLDTMGNPTDPWELVLFDNQRGIENAVAGKRLGPSDVDACPEFKICNDIEAELIRSHFHEVVGVPGSGKSITGWQVARRFHRNGFAVWRPKALPKHEDLLASIPHSQRTILFIDDAHQFGKNFVDRLSELSRPNFKVLFASTVQDSMQANKICISPEHCVQELANALLPRRIELLKIIQQYDEDISDRYMGVLLEDRISRAKREKRPWEFFWVLRGGWKTARREFESLNQFPNATEVLLLIAIGQIASCDAGVEETWVVQHGELANINRNQVESAVAKLRQLNLVIGDESIRTKHISYAYRIVEYSFATTRFQSWEISRRLFVHSLLNDNWSLRGVSWTLDAIRFTDAFRWKSNADASAIIVPLLKRCVQERFDLDWAAGLLARLINHYDMNTNEILTHRQCIIDLVTSRCGLVSYFCGDIINSLINKSNWESNDSARNFIDEIDYVSLAELANTVTMNDLASFGKLLDRFAYYGPQWAERFLKIFNWGRIREIILNADTKWDYAIDDFVTALTKLLNKDDRGVNLQFIEETIPFIVRAINDDPSSAIGAMDGIFMTCLGYAPKFLRGGSAPNDNQTRVANKILTGLNPGAFARAMENASPRDLEKLARAYEVIHEVNQGFLSKISLNLSEHKFYENTRNGWNEQSSELQHVILFFGLDKHENPSGRWVRDNRSHIEGPLCPLFVCLAPDLAVDFYKSGRIVNIVHGHWKETAYAIKRIYKIDKQTCAGIVEQSLLKLQDAMYELSLDPANHLLHFFRTLFQLLPELFNKLVDALSLDHPMARKTVERLKKNQPKELEHYRKLAKYGQCLTGRIAVLSNELYQRLSQK